MGVKMSIFECKNPDFDDPKLLDVTPGKKSFSSNFKNLFNFNKKKSNEELLSKRICCGVHRDWGNGSITQERAFEKMRNNLSKALHEHEIRYAKGSVQRLSDLNPFIADFEENHEMKSFKSNINFSENDRFILRISDAQYRGPRPTMEDAHFCLPFKKGTLVGVLDGHGGIEVANYASRKIQELFPKVLKKLNNNVHQAFEKVFLKVQEKIIQKPEFNGIGSTAVISFIERKTKLIYTATLGDSEASLYRAEDNYKCTPLSCVRSWASKKDEMRVQNGTNEKDYESSIVYVWNNYKDAQGNLCISSSKYRRVSVRGTVPLKTSTNIENNDKDLDETLSTGINVSRAFGDHAYNIGRNSEVVIAKPKITCCPMAPGVLILACDGLKDYVDEGKIVTCIEKNHSEPAGFISNKLIELAKKDRTKDNVTVLTVVIEAEKDKNYLS